VTKGKDSFIIRRRDAWKEPRYFSIATVVGKTDPRMITKINDVLPGNAIEKLTETEILKACREIIVYKQNNGLFGASLICAAICAERRAFAFYHFLDAVDMDEEELIKTLALCEIYEIPVFHDTLELNPILEELFTRLYENGFDMKYGEDGKRRMLLRKSIGGAPLGEIELSPDETLPKFVQPVLAISNQIRIDRFRQLFWHTANFLEGFARGIERLEQALCVDNVTEHVLQRILETHPELFGLSYQRVEPQFAFAEKFVADFAFFTGQGSTVFVEIESARRKLFTKKGDQTADLTHAIGQVTSWHQWIAQNALYARDKIPNVEAPYSLIVIGRDAFLTERDRTTLNWINSVNRHQYRIVTYDDLLAEAKALLLKLTGAQVVDAGVASKIGEITNLIGGSGVKAIDATPPN